MSGIFRKTLTPSPYKYIQNSYGCPFSLFGPDMERCQFFSVTKHAPQIGVRPAAKHYLLTECLLTTISLIRIDIKLSKSPIAESQESNLLSDICWFELPLLAKSMSRNAIRTFFGPNRWSLQKVDLLLLPSKEMTPRTLRLMEILPRCCWKGAL